MFKYIVSLIFICNSYADLYIVKCKKEDCFKYGWSMSNLDKSYQLDAECKQFDCMNLGWTSIDTKGSRFDVSCKIGGCFERGWMSIEKLGLLSLYDDVNCKDNGCLIDGWTIKSRYSSQKGEVSCLNSSCSINGGVSFWRGRKSSTQCIDFDCYRYGWVLKFER